MDTTVKMLLAALYAIVGGFVVYMWTLEAESEVVHIVASLMLMTIPCSHNFMAVRVLRSNQRLLEGR